MEVRLAAEERLMAAYTRYEEVWELGDRDAVPAARLDLCQALLDAGEELSPPVLAQMERDRALVTRPLVIAV